MNILYIDHYAGSPELGMEYRPYYLSREWVRSGHRVRLVAASFSHVRAHQPEVPHAGMMEMLDGIEYQWIATPPYRGNGVGRVLNIWSFLQQLWRSAAAIVQEFKPDLVIASSTYPMDIWVARRIARMSGAKLVFEMHDLWPLSPIELSGMSPYHPFALLCARAERTAYRDVDAVVSMLPKVHDFMSSRGLDLRKLTIVPNAISPDDWIDDPTPLREDVAACLAAAHAAGRTVVGYAGSMGQPNALDVLLDAMARLRDLPVSVVMVGDGHERERLAGRVAAEELAHVHMFPPIPKNQVPSFLSAIDIAYIGWKRVAMYRYGIAPNKLMDYMMARCVVLHSVEAGNDSVADAGCGLTVQPESSEAVIDGLHRLLAIPLEDRRRMGERGRAFVLAEHTYPVMAERFLAAVNNAHPNR
jgi:glycosyltransferase involved in cell wall biosynthesis